MKQYCPLCGAELELEPPVKLRADKDLPAVGSLRELDQLFEEDDRDFDLPPNKK